MSARPGAFENQEPALCLYSLDNGEVCVGRVRVAGGRAKGVSCSRTERSVRSTECREHLSRAVIFPFCKKIYVEKYCKKIIVEF